MTEIKAVIFDMDGVVSDTQKLHASVEESLLKKYGIKMDVEEITEKYAGVPDRKVFERIFRDNNILVDVDKVIKEKWDKMFSLTKNNVSPISGAMELINELKNNGFKLGIASSSPIRFIELVLSELGLKEKFYAITGAEEVKYGKPDPQIFLLTARKLRVTPKECVVIEDGISGMIAAKRAGMKCIGLVEKENRDYPADLIVRSLREIKIENLKIL